MSEIDGGSVVQHGSLRDLLLRPNGERVRAFLGSRAQELALGALRLRHVAGELAAVAPTADLPRLSAEMPYGQALVALAGLDEGTPVAVGDAPGRVVAAGALRARILEDTKTAGGMP